MRPRRLGRVLSAATLACAIVACFAPVATQAATPVQQAYAKASNTGATDQFGYSVAISGDTMVIGAPFEDSSATGVGGDGTNNSAGNSGAAYVFTRDAGGTWTQQAYLKASNTGADDFFGYSVAISGETIVIGAAIESSSATGVGGDQSNNGAFASGAAYVFTRNEGTWSQQAYLKASNTGGNDRFGYSAAISGDTIVVGARGEGSNATGVGGNQTNNSATGSGAAYVFTRSDGNWTQQAYLKASNTGANDAFGYSAAISGDTIVVGASFENSTAAGSGAAYVFTRSDGNWTHQAHLKASNAGDSDQFGYSAGVSGDTIVVGAILESSSATGVGGEQANDDAFASGAAYVFTRSDGNWTQQAYLKASNTGANDFFGTSAAISGDTIVIGAYGESSSATGVGGDQSNDDASSSGAAYAFTRSAGTWTQQAYLKASNTGADDNFGLSAAISGETIVVGAVLESSSSTGVGGDQANGDASFSGAAYVYSPKATTQTALTCTPDTRQIGEASTCTAQVTGANPTGSVSFNADGAGGLDITSCSLTAGSCSVAYTPSAVGDGTHTVTASYQGDAANEVSSGTDDVTATKATTAMVTSATATVTLGQSISDQATLSGGQNPTGSITFRAFGPNDATCSNAPAYTSAAVAVSGNGTYANSPTFTPTAAGTYRWIASYSGDSNNEAVSGTCNDPNEASVVASQTVVNPPSPTPTGQRAAALKKCKKIEKAAARRKCKRKANKLPA